MNCRIVFAIENFNLLLLTYSHIIARPARRAITLFINDSLAIFAERGSINDGASGDSAYFKQEVEQWRLSTGGPQTEVPVLALVRLGL